MLTSRKPFPHQQQVFNWSKSRKRLAYFLQMRLGKSLCAIMWAMYHDPHNSLPKLIVSPSDTLPVWQEELAYEHQRSLILTGSPTERINQIEDHPYTDWYLTNGEGLFQHGRLSKQPKPTQLTQLPWGFVIVDESVRIKNPKALITKTCIRYFNRVPYRAILSGLPNPEGPQDFFTQMMFLHGQFMGFDNFWKWRDTYFTHGFTDWDWIPKHGALKAIRKAVEENSYFLKRNDVGLANKRIYEKRVIELPKPFRKLYDIAESDFALGSLETNWRIVVDNWLQQIAGGFPKGIDKKSTHKLDSLKSILQGDLRKEPTIIWFRYNRELFKVCEALQNIGIKSAPISGKEDMPERYRVIHSFQKGKLDNLCVQIKCGRYAHNYSRATAAIIYSGTWSNDERCQIEDRIEHPKKKEPLLFIDLLTAATIEEDLYKAIRFKKLKSSAFRQNVVENFRARLRSKLA